VRLPAAPGRGGRCQSLALAAAVVLRECPGGLLLAAGTDGSDGPGEDAGALVDAGTVDRGREAGLEAGTCLAMADAGRFLAASGDLITTGPTGTNVMDLVFGLRIDVVSTAQRPTGFAGIPSGEK
jgi:hydroxypyruvate reductase